MASKLSDVKLDLAYIEVGSFRLNSGSSLVGKALAESHLRKLHGITILLIRRGDQVLPNPASTLYF